MNLPDEFDGYHIERLLGRGAMGEVHLAHDALLDRPVAIKLVMTPADPVARQRFLIEARAVARLQHPNVVSVYRVGEVAGMPYLVSEFVPGVPLSELPIPVNAELALKIAVDLSNGMAAAHRRGVVHRDIKPANAMLSDEGPVKLLDFGIAKLLCGSDPAHEQTAEHEPPADADLVATVLPSPPSEQPAGRELPADADRTATVVPIPASESQWNAAPRPDADRTATVVPTPASESQWHAAPRPDADRTATVVPTPASESQWHAAPRPGAMQGEGMEPADAAVLTRTGAVLGTPRYMAPEIWAGGAATFRSDVYSFGALLYTVCAGRPPHDGKGVSELRQQVKAGVIVPLASVAPGVDPGLAAVVDRCLAHDPARRFASGGELRAAVARLLPGARKEPAASGNPYRGLQAFEAEHRDLFFGRDSETSLILGQLRDSGFVVVAGDSGLGKSSLCRAGVLPRIESHLGGSQPWTVLTLVPGRHPIAALAAVLAPVLAEDEAATAAALIEDPAGVARRLRAPRSDRSGVVLFVDQLEELVTLSDASEAIAASHALTWLSVPAPRARLLATVRSDFLGRVASLPGLGDLVPRALFFLRPLTAERLRDVIVEPAQLSGGAFESTELVDELVRATADTGGGLPLLQFALAKLWDARPPSGVISRATLDGVGGVAGALAGHADTVLASMSDGAREAARRILVRLVSVEGTRAERVAVEASTSKNEADALEALVRGRLVVVRDGPERPTYEIAHEALATAWPTLTSWLSVDAGAERMLRRLSLAAEEWERLGQTTDALWSRRQLAELEVFDGLLMRSAERRFVAASRRSHRRRTALRALAIGAIPLALILGGVGLQLVAQHRLRARVDAGMEQARALLTEARAREADAARSAEHALAMFDGRAPRDRAEEAWAKHREGASEVRLGFARAAQALEATMMLDDTRTDVRAAFADILLEQALMADRDHDSPRVEELLSRLAVHDEGGVRRQIWEQPAEVALEGLPEGATVALSRYSLDARGRYEPVPLAPNGTWPTQLAPGSYLAEVEAPGHVGLRHPFVARRGQQQRIAVDLLRPSELVPGFAYVAAGSFLWGSSAPDEQRRDFFHHVPIHEVELPGYLVAVNETTFADWVAFLDALAPEERAKRLPLVGKGGFQGGLELSRDEDGGWRLRFKPAEQLYDVAVGQPVVYPGRKEHASHDWLRLPVVGIRAEDAEAYARWAQASGRVPGARLCTEQEWERAARGADGREYPHGERLWPEQANFDATYGKLASTMGPDEVGSHPSSASPYGVHDLAGNVWEWTRSPLSPTGYAARGGSYAFGAASARTTDREETESSFRDASVGFRLCADLPARLQARNR